MGGLIGMALAGQPGLPLPAPIRRLVLNDVGPVIEWSALERIGQYLGKGAHFENLGQAAHALLLISEGFGPHSEGQWLRLTRPMMRPAADGGLVLHYDPQIAVPLQHMTREMAQAGEALLWQLYDQIKARVLLVRGAQSDLLTAATAQAMRSAARRRIAWNLKGWGMRPPSSQQGRWPCCAGSYGEKSACQAP